MARMFQWISEMGRKVRELGKPGAGTPSQKVQGTRGDVHVDEFPANSTLGSVLKTRRACPRRETPSPASRGLSPVLRTGFGLGQGDAAISPKDAIYESPGGLSYFNVSFWNPGEVILGALSRARHFYELRQAEKEFKQIAKEDGKDVDLERCIQAPGGYCGGPGMGKRAVTTSASAGTKWTGITFDSGAGASVIPHGWPAHDVPNSRGLRFRTATGEKLQGGNDAILYGTDCKGRSLALRGCRAPVSAPLLSDGECVAKGNMVIVTSNGGMIVPAGPHREALKMKKDMAAI